MTDDAPPPPAEPPPPPPPEPTVEVASGLAFPALATDDPALPTLPPTTGEVDLRDAVGARPPSRASSKRRPEHLDAPPPKLAPVPAKRAEPEDDDDAAEASPRSRKTLVVGAIALVLGLAIAALIFLGRANSDRFELACTPDKIVAMQGRAFPPWGTKPIGDPDLKPIEIPPEAECVARTTEDRDELAGWFLDALVDRASTSLTAREVTKVDLAEQQLQQALLLARTPDKKDKRADIERLLGDVSYWRASAKLRDAAAALADAAKQFDAAAAQRPRHVSDASAWAGYIRKLVDELHVGPRGAPAPFPPIPPLERPSPTDHPPAPPGVALPIEPSGGGSATPPNVPTTAIDAGVPSGGVLL